MVDVRREQFYWSVTFHQYAVHRIGIGYSKYNSKMTSFIFIQNNGLSKQNIHGSVKRLLNSRSVHDNGSQIFQSGLGNSQYYFTQNSGDSQYYFTQKTPTAVESMQVQSFSNPFTLPPCQMNGTRQWFLAPKPPHYLLSGQFLFCLCASLLTH